MTRDIGSLMLRWDDGGLSLDFFRGVIRTAEMLGHEVTIREIRDRSGRLHSLVASIDEP